METIHLTGGTKWTALFSTCFVPIYTDLSLGWSPCCQMFHCQSELLRYTKNDSRRRSLFFHLLFYPCPGDSTCSCLLRNVTDACLCCLMFLIKKKKKRIGPSCRDFLFISVCFTKEILGALQTVSDSNCDWTLKAACVRNWKKLLILSIRGAVELKAKGMGF